MITSLLTLANLPLAAFILFTCAAFAAGLVRGFAGFGLSAVLMASIATIVPPIELIPVCFLLEGVASLAMIRGGMKEADMKVVWGLVIGSTIGIPIGLAATVSIDVETSKLLALLCVLGLTTAQFFNLQPKYLQTTPGLYGSGLVSGIVSGLASIGGMVVALYVLASGTKPQKMRASLIMFLLIGMFTSAVYFLLFGVMTETALWRGAIFTPAILLGVLGGSFMFRPSLIHLYKRCCLILLIALCLTGVYRQLF